MGDRGLFELAGKFALVTGGTRGIGLMIARGFVQAGAEVVISSRDADTGDRAAAELRALVDDGRRVITIPANLADEAECERLAAAVGEHTDRLDVLVNNAGATWGAPLEEFPVAAWTKVLGLNVTAPFVLTRACLPLLRAAASADDPARVINVGSIDGIRVPRGPNYSYSASKAAIHQLTRVLAIEFGPEHITVNAIAPGPFETKMMAATLREHGDAIVAAAPLGRLGRPDDMAGVTTFLASRAGSYVTGTIIPVDGGISTA